MQKNKCDCLFSDSKVIESRKDDDSEVVFRGRKCNNCNSIRVTVEIDFLEMKTSRSLPFINIPWNDFRLAELKRTQQEYSKLEDCLVSSARHL